MKVIVEYNLPEDQDLLKEFHNLDNFRNSIIDIREFLESNVENNKNLSKQAKINFVLIQEKVNKILMENNILHLFY